jgi:15-cis-phytoene synthase
MNVKDALLIKGFNRARKLTEKHAKTFFFASHLLPKEERDASYAIYAVCRLSDDAVDVHGISDLSKLQDKINLAYSIAIITDPILRAFQHTVKTYDIPKCYFDELIEGFKMDVTKRNYADFNELYIYCYRVAGIVGLMMNKLLGGVVSGEEPAVELGVAMQLTNILRDIKEDIKRGRVYLPQDEMDKFGVDEDMLARGVTNDRFKALMRYQMERAKERYKKSLIGIPSLKSRRSRIVVLLMKEMYEAILFAVEKRGFDVFSKRAYTTSFQKLWILIRVLVSRKYLSSYVPQPQ